jgi:hypothetical protein
LRDRSKHWKLELSKLIRRVQRLNMLKASRTQKIMNLWGTLVGSEGSKVSRV